MSGSCRNPQREPIAQFNKRVYGTFEKQKEAINIWYCTQKAKCQWQGFALHQGLAWGRIPPKTDAWRRRHDENCGGTLVQISQICGEDTLEEIEVKD